MRLASYCCPKCDDRKQGQQGLQGCSANLQEFAGCMGRDNVGGMLQLG